MVTRKRFQRTLALAAVLAVSAGLAACGDDDDSGSGSTDGTGSSTRPRPRPRRRAVLRRRGEPISVGFVAVGPEGAWRAANEENMQETFTKENGFDLKYAPATNLDQKSQIDAFTSFVDEGVDVILLSATEGAGWEDSLKRAQEAEIPVILIDRGIEPDDTSLYVTRIAPDNFEVSDSRSPSGPSSAFPDGGELLRARGPRRRRRSSTSATRAGTRSSDRQPELRQGRRADRQLVGRRGQERLRDGAQGQQQRHPARLRAERRDGSRRGAGRRGSRPRARRGRQDRHDRRHQGRASRRSPPASSASSPSTTRCSARPPSTSSTRRSPASRSSRTSSCRATTFDSPEAAAGGAARPASSDRPHRTVPRPWAVVPVERTTAGTADGREWTRTGSAPAVSAADGRRTRAGDDGGVDVTSPAPIVEMHGISIAFPGVKALDDVDFRLFPGEVHALMGENGAGKSTLIKALTGVYPIDAGEIVDRRPASAGCTAPPTRRPPASPTCTRRSTSARTSPSART